MGVRGARPLKGNIDSILDRVGKWGEWAVEAHYRGKGRIAIKEKGIYRGMGGPPKFTRKKKSIY